MGGFLETNPSIETVLSSFQTICSALDSAPNQWWQHGKDAENDKVEEDDIDRNQNSHRYHDDDNEDGNESGSDDEMIVLNPEAPRRPATDSQDSTQDADEIAANNDPNWLGNLGDNSDDGSDHDE